MSSFLRCVFLLAAGFSAAPPVHAGDGLPPRSQWKASSSSTENPAMASALPREDAERLKIAPLSVEDGMLHVAVAFPVPMRGHEVLVRKLGRSVAQRVSTDVRVRSWRSHIY